MNIDEIRQLAEILRDTGLESIEVESKGQTLRMKMPSSNSEGFLTVRHENAELAPLALRRTDTEKTEGEVKALGELITSPMVGVFYSAPSPAEKNFVGLGDTVEAGDTLCIVEAMKLLNEITAEFSGEVTEILAENGNVVEYGQPLFRIARRLDAAL